MINLQVDYDDGRKFAIISPGYQPKSHFFPPTPPPTQHTHTKSVAKKIKTDQISTYRLFIVYILLSGIQITTTPRCAVLLLDGRLQLAGCADERLSHRITGTQNNSERMACLGCIISLFAITRSGF
jgi:hypothetical protein